MGKLKNKLIEEQDRKLIEAEKTRHLDTYYMNTQDNYIKYLLWFVLAYFGGHVLYYIGLELSCYLYGVFQ